MTCVVFARTFQILYRARRYVECYAPTGPRSVPFRERIIFAVRGGRPTIRSCPSCARGVHTAQMPAPSPATSPAA